MTRQAKETTTILSTDLIDNALLGGIVTSNLKPRRVRGALAVSLAGVTVLALATACSSSKASPSGSGGSCTPPKSPQVTLAAYSNPYDAYGKLTSTFAADWKDKHKQTLIFSMSFGGSTTQAQNIINGFKADIYASSLAPDVGLVQKAGLITHDWQHQPDGSVVATSVVGFMVRPGNPKGIHDWSDLAKPGLKVLTPDPSQSGGAKWNIVAAYGAAMRGKIPGYSANNPDDAERYLEALFKNVTVLDKSANDSFKNFESGNGDVAITYENQALAGIASGSKDKFVIPSSTVLIQTPTVVVDENAKSHCIENIADAFVSYLHTADAQDVFAKVGYQRPIQLAKAKAGDGDQYPAIKDLFTTDDLGGWDKLASETVFGSAGVFTKAFQAVHH
jgi:sulfate/thiosulfate transport system substrate-binding protein